jgi:hypothetical protein
MAGSGRSGFGGTIGWGCVGAGWSGLGTIGGGTVGSDMGRAYPPGPVAHLGPTALREGSVAFRH